MTTDAHALRQAIITDPDDTLVRLIYADYLEEQNDPRAEFIRVQCELAELPEWDERRWELWLREKKLLGEFHDKWRREDLGENKFSCEFVRGFVEGISTSAEVFLKQGDDLFQQTPLRKVSLHEARHSVPQLAECSLLRHLETLSLAGMGNQIGALELEKLLASPFLAKLRDLVLRNEEVRDASIQVLCRSKVLNQLQELDLHGNQFDANGMEELTRSQKLQRLQYLDLSRNRLGAAGAQILADCRDLPELQILNLSQIELSAQGLRSLALGQPRPELRQLFLKENPVGNEGVEALAGSPHFPVLELLDLGECEIGRSGLRQLISSSHFPHLRCLRIPENRFAWESLGYWKECYSLVDLKWLDVSRNPLGDEGVKNLVSSPLLSSLTRVDLSACD